MKEQNIKNRDYETRLVLANAVELIKGTLDKTLTPEVNSGQHGSKLTDEEICSLIGVNLKAELEKKA